MGRYWIEREDWEKARRALERAYDLDDGDSETLLDLGRALWELEQDQDARACYERVMELNNDPDCVRRAKEALEKSEEDD